MAGPPHLKDFLQLALIHNCLLAIYIARYFVRRLFEDYDDVQQRSRTAPFCLAL